MKECDYCRHVEMCRWREDAEGQGCEFFDDGNKRIPVDKMLPEKKVWVLCTVEQNCNREKIWMTLSELFELYWGERRDEE